MPPPDPLAWLALQQQLILDAGACADPAMLHHTLLNQTHRLIPCERATLWSFERGRAELLGVSGLPERPGGPLVDTWQKTADALRSVRMPEPTAALDSALASPSRADEDAAGADPHAPSGSALWIPLTEDEHVRAGLLLERQSAPALATEDAERALPLALGYSIAWRAVHGRKPARRPMALVAILTALGLLLALLLVRAPITVVAPCEIVPKDAVAVTAPLAGVVARVTADPGSSVREGDLLAVYEKQVFLHEVEVARQQVRMVESDLHRAHIAGTSDPSRRAEALLLENRLAQEEARLRLAENRVTHLEVLAPASGSVVLQDPEVWRGRPVQTGERLLVLMDPARTRIRLWIPEEHAAPLEPGQTIRILLQGDPSRTYAARLTYISPAGAADPAGQPAFAAEAEWEKPEEGPPPGLRGHAVLQGPEMPLGAMLLRRPLRWLRLWLGV